MKILRLVLEVNSCKEKKKKGTALALAPQIEITRLLATMTTFETEVEHILNEILSSKSVTNETRQTLLS